MHDQAKLWNGPSARSWIDQQPVLDRMFEPIARLLVDAAVESGAQSVLDVGCGTGATTLAIARHTSCVGIDISEPMIAVARERAQAEGSRASFIAADAGTHGFEPERYDLVVSRFGVMFFPDPALAFANLRRAATEDARLALVAFRSAAENPFMTTAERAAAPLLPNLPPRRTDGGPGQFAFADSARVKRIFADTGWGDVTLEAVDIACAFPESALLGYLTRLGPLGLALQGESEARRADVIQEVRAAFDAFVVEDEVRFDAACWMIRRASEASEES